MCLRRTIYVSSYHSFIGLGVCKIKSLGIHVSTSASEDCFSNLQIETYFKAGTVYYQSVKKSQFQDDDKLQ